LSGVEFLNTEVLDFPAALTLEVWRVHDPVAFSAGTADEDGGTFNYKHALLLQTFPFFLLLTH
jgi:hypothetical protein